MFQGSIIPPSFFPTKSRTYINSLPVCNVEIKYPSRLYVIQNYIINRVAIPQYLSLVELIRCVYMIMGFFFLYMKDKKVVADGILEEFYLPTGPLFIYSACTTIGPPGNQPKVVQIPGVPLHKNVLEVDRISWIAWIYFCTCLPVSTDVCCKLQ